MVPQIFSKINQQLNEIPLHSFLPAKNISTHHHTHLH
jgi:hypothetical protein